jgi:Ca-activated chloride channel family protein
MVVFLLALASSALLGIATHAQLKSKSSIVQDVELVQIPVIVFDDKGAVATNLSKDDFRLVEDGVEQKVLLCERERESVSFVILADVSQSMTKKIPFVREAAISVLDPASRQSQYHDEFSVFDFGSRVSRLVPFTRDQQDLEDRLPSLLMPTKGSTALFDGLYAGVNAAEGEAANKRRAVIIISDGGDNHSRYNLRQTRSFLQEADVPVFAVMAGPLIELSALVPGLERKPTIHGLPLPSKDTDFIGPAERNGPHILKTLTEVSGGGVFTARNLEDLPRIIRTIGSAVRYRYVLAYEPHGAEQAKRENNWHKVHLELTPKEKFAGYSVPYYKQGYYKIN